MCRIAAEVLIKEHVRTAWNVQWVFGSFRAAVPGSPANTEFQITVGGSLPSNQQCLSEVHGWPSEAWGSHE